MDSTLVHVDRAVDVTRLQIKVANLVIKAQLGIQLRSSLETLDDIEVNLNRLTGLVFLFELTCFVLELFDVQNGPQIDRLESSDRMETGWNPPQSR